MLIASTLAFSQLFIYASLTPFFFYCLSAGIFIVFSGVVIFSSHVKSINALGITSFIIIVLWAVYIALNNYVLHVPGGLKQTYLLVCFALFAAALFTFSSSFHKHQAVFSVISFFAGIESLYCFLQFFLILPSHNLYFSVTGTWVNPNVTAMFLAMSFPALLYFIITRRDKWQKYYIILLLLVLTALIMLKCRTAIIGVAIASAFILQHHYHLIRWFNKKFSTPVKAVLLVIVLVVISFISFYAYRVKKESADGRQLIWKLSANMIVQKPITGYGYGTFERNYNLAQAAYFGAGKGTDAEKANASQVLMAYNEYLENMVEGGIAGLIFFVLFLAILLYAGLKSLHQKDPATIEPLHSLQASTTSSKKTVLKEKSILVPGAVTYGGLLAFACMSFINFTFAAIPAMCLFILYAAIFASTGSFSKQFKVSPLLQKTFGIFFIVLGGLFIYSNAGTAIAHHQVKSAVELTKTGDMQRALELLKKQPSNVRNTESYCRTLGGLCILDKHYDSALVLFQQASLITSSPDLYMQIGYCQQALQQYDKAIAAYQTASFIHPVRFAPRDAVLLLYLLQQDTTNALKTAKEILALEPKIKRKEIEQYKRTASAVIQRLLKSS